MKKNYNKLISLIISLIVVVLSICLLFGNKKDFSSNENRYLQKLPKFTFKRLVKGDFINDFESYLTDHFPLRDFFVSIKTTSEKILGKTDINGVYIGKDDYLIEKYNKPLNNEKIINKFNTIYDSLNYLNMNIMLVPTSISIYSDKLPKYAFYEDEKDNIDYIYNNVKINNIDLYDSLVEHKNEYNLYYKLDHHWTTYGAYYGYYEYAKSNNIEPISIDKFNITKVSDSFNGTFYSKTNDYTRKSDSIYMFTLDNTSYSIYYDDTNTKTDTLYNMDYLNVKDKYSMFLDNNHNLIEITNNNINTNKELVVIKDSYANSLVPFLVNHYKKVYVIDPRYYRLSIIDFIKEKKGITDVLFVYNINGIDNDAGLMSIH